MRRFRDGRHGLAVDVPRQVASRSIAVDCAPAVTFRFIVRMRADPLEHGANQPPRWHSGLTSRTRWNTVQHPGRATRYLRHELTLLPYPRADATVLGGMWSAYSRRRRLAVPQQRPLGEGSTFMFGRVNFAQQNRQIEKSVILQILHQARSKARYNMSSWAQLGLLRCPT